MAHCRSKKDTSCDNGNETAWVPGPYREPHRRAADLKDAARLILEAGPREGANAGTCA